MQNHIMHRKEKSDWAIWVVVLPIFIVTLFATAFSGNVAPVLFSYFVLTFYFPAKAMGWKSLGVRASLILGPLFLLLAFTLREPNEGTLNLVVLAIPPFLGTVARVLSLSAAKLGHSRPRSLWIEALFFLLPFIYAAVAILG